MAVTEARVAGIEKQVCEHDEFINGNGKPGAKVQLNTLEINYQNISKKLDQIYGAITGLALSVVGAVLVYILLNVIPHVAK